MKTALLIATFILASPACAIGFVQRDLYAPGDGLIVHDPVSGLEWLNVNVAAGQSFNQVETGSLHTELGFTHGSWEQVRTLIFDAIGANEFGLTFSSGAALYSDPMVVRAIAFFDAIGGTVVPGFDRTDRFLNGLVSDGVPLIEDPSLSPHFYPGWRLFTDNEEPEDTILLATFFQKLEGGTVLIEPDAAVSSHFLVRQTPEGGPGLAILALMGGATAVVRRRQSVAG